MLAHQEKAFKERERRIAEYSQLMAEREEQNFKLFNSPQYITHAKQEVLKTQKINDLNNKLH